MSTGPRDMSPVDKIPTVPDESLLAEERRVLPSHKQFARGFGYVIRPALSRPLNRSQVGLLSGDGQEEGQRPWWALLAVMDETKYCVNGKTVYKVPDRLC